MACPHITESNVRFPSANSLIYKEECTLCFNNWDNEEGIFVCLNCFNGGCIKHAKMHFYKRNHPIALNIRRVRKPQPVTEENTAERPQKITKLAIGVPGGIQTEESEDLFDYPTKVFCVPCDKEIEATGRLAEVATAIVKANSVSKQEDKAAWENQIIQCEHTITLQQTPNAAKLAKKALSHCSSCELNSNLWLCLSCGYLGCGRKNYDGTGGNGHALAHAEKEKHHVVCKLGTITPEGTADIHCYACDELRLDPYLADHLATFGIEVADQEKTEKSLAEMELEQNLKLDLNSTVDAETGKKRVNLYGPGYTGLKNLGNTCYMASVFQIMFAIPEFKERYLNQLKDHQSNCTVSNPSQCYLCQMYKLADGIHSGRYSIKKKEEKEGEGEEEEQDGIPPRMIKSLLCKDHPEFSTMKQQDAYEFYQFMIKTIQQKERSNNIIDPTRSLEFIIQQKIKCNNCNRVRYSTIKQNELSLQIPLEYSNPPLSMNMIDGEKESDRAKRESQSRVDFINCFNTFLYDENISHFNCPNCKSVTTASKSYRLKSYPNILAIHMRRFVFEDWVPRKLSVSVDVPNPSNKDKSSVIDLSHAISNPIDENEQLLDDNDDKSSSSSSKPELNDNDIDTLIGMGFTRVRAERAIWSTGNNGAEVAMNWLFEHLDDPDIDNPIPTSSSKSSNSSSSSSINISDDTIQQLSEMGFTKSQAIKALQETDGNIDRAVEWLFSHADQLNDMNDTISNNNEQQQQQQPMDIDNTNNNTSTRYRLKGFIVHRGVSTHSGHYVSYLYIDNPDNLWVEFNDRKVTVIDNPPIHSAYMLFFEKLN